MRKTTKIAIVVVVVAILLLGIGYAALSNITLNIGGTVTANPNEANFVTRFTESVIVSNPDKVTATIEEDLNATLEVRNLTELGETVTAEYTIENASADLESELEIKTENSNTEYFSLEAELQENRLESQGTTTVVVSVTLIKEPIEESVEATVNITLTATPIQPGDEEDEGSAELTPDNKTGTLADMTNDNIGDRIDLGNDIVEGLNIERNITTDDWKVLYVDDNLELVYVILTKYLPNSTGYASNAGLTTKNTHNVFESETQSLYSALNNPDNWIGLTNGISGAVAYGAPSADMLVNSYNIAFGKNEVYTQRPKLSGMYLFNDSSVGCEGYWLSTMYQNDIEDIYICHSDGYVDSEYSISEAYGIRPVVALPFTTPAELVLDENEVEIWNIK